MTHSYMRHDLFVCGRFHVTTQLFSSVAAEFLMCEWVMSRRWMIRVTCIIWYNMYTYIIYIITQTCRDTAQPFLSVAAEFLMCEWVMSRRWMSRVTCIIWYNMYTYIIHIIAQTCRDTAQLAAFRHIRAHRYSTAVFICGCRISYIRLSHVSHMNEAYHMCKCADISGYSKLSSWLSEHDQLGGAEVR